MLVFSTACSAANDATRLGILTQTVENQFRRFMPPHHHEVGAASVTPWLVAPVALAEPVPLKEPAAPPSSTAT